MKKHLFTVVFLVIAALPGWAQSDSIHLEEVVVTGTRARVSRANLPATISVVHRQEIEESGASALLNALSGHVPGLFVSERGVLGFGVGSAGSGTITMRGTGGGTGVLVLVDGHPRYVGVMGHHMPDALTAAHVERVEVIRGPASLLYGSNAMGGVVNIITRDAGDGGFNGGGRVAGGSFGTSTLQVHGGTRGERWETFFSLGHDRTDGHRANRSARFASMNGYAKAAVRLSPAFRLWADLNVTAYEAQNPGTEANPLVDNVVDILRGVASLSLENRFGKSHGALTLFYNFGDHEINDGYTLPASPRDFRFRSRDHNHGFQLYQTILPLRGMAITAGIDYKRFGGRAWDAYLDARPDNVNVDTSLREVAAYVVFQQTLFDRLTLNVGARLEHNQRFGSEWIPQAGIAYRPTPGGILKLAVAKGFRSPTIRDLFYKAGWAGANPDLKPESVVNHEFSVGQSFFRDALDVEATAYLARGKNRIVTNRTGGIAKTENSGTFDHRGIELSARWTATRHLRFRGNYAYLHTKQPVLYAPARQLNFAATYHRPTWQLTATYRDISGLRSTTSRQESYRLLDIHASYRPLAWLALFVNGDNLTATRYQIIDGNPMPRATFTGGLNFTF